MFQWNVSTKVMSYEFNLTCHAFIKFETLDILTSAGVFTPGYPRQLKT